MERHFGLPIAFAAAAHGALLFGFPHAHTSKPSLREEKKIIAIPLPPRVEPDIETTREFERTESPAPPPLERSRPTLRPIDVTTVVTKAEPVIQPITNLDTHITIPSAPERPAGAGLEGFAPGVILGTDLDNSPRTRFQPAPIYPHDAKYQGLTGEVLMEFVVDESGRVHDPHVVKSSHRVFEEPAVRAISRWQFEPGRRLGQLVRFRMVVPIVFSLSE